MKIGFDAKRAFHNHTGLGNYSRTLIGGLAGYYPQHEYFLFNPKPSPFYQPPGDHIKEVLPAGIIQKRFSSFWRSSWVSKDVKKLGLDLYHGLSNEIPVGLSATGIPSVVTIHDLIFERFPEQFNRIDVSIYRKKYRHACKHAKRIIAISEQTKNDIIEIYGIDDSKIDICYQSCNPVFEKKISDEKKQQVKNQFQLPAEFFLSVGSVIERKNLLNTCKAMVMLKDELPMSLVVVGKGGAYLQKVKQFISENGLKERVIFLSEKNEKLIYPLHEPETLAALYQMSVALIYPSLFEGFGIPVLEALWSEAPVITSRTSCLPEAGGDSALYVDPSSSKEIAAAMKQLYGDIALRERMIGLGMIQARKFSLETTTNALMQVYQKLAKNG